MRGEAIKRRSFRPPPPTRVPIPSSGASRADPTPRAIALPCRAIGRTLASLRSAPLASRSFTRRPIPFVLPVSAPLSQEATPNAKAFGFGLRRGRRSRTAATANARASVGGSISLFLFLSLPLSRSSLVRGLYTVPKTSTHLLSRKESERTRAGRNPGQRERVGGCVRACVCVRARKSGVRDKKLRGTKRRTDKEDRPPCARTRHYAGRSL